VIDGDLVQGTGCWLACSGLLEAAGATASLFTGQGLRGQTVTLSNATLLLVRRLGRPAPAWRSGTELGAEGAGCSREHLREAHGVTAVATAQAGSDTFEGVLESGREFAPIVNWDGVCAVSRAAAAAARGHGTDGQQGGGGGMGGHGELRGSAGDSPVRALATACVCSPGVLVEFLLACGSAQRTVPSRWPRLLTRAFWNTSATQPPRSAAPCQ
jgi:hypothetical protein